MVKWGFFVAFFAAVLVSGLLIMRGTMSAQTVKVNDQPKSDDKTGEPFAVVELFTSEGCSSCPPADALLAEISAESQKKHQHIYCLSFHVDYWNNLGWRDPYSDAAFSRRQQGYAKVFKSDQVYTPQMVVNGSAEFVGSDRARARKQIDSALKQPTGVAVKLSQEQRKDPRAAVVAYDVSQAPRDSVLNVALVERGLVSEVKRGENGGRTLRHENVVRAFQTLRLDKAEKGTVRLQVPTGVVRKNSSIIAYVQKSDTWAVLGATAIELSQGDDR